MTSANDWDEVGGRVKVNKKRHEHEDRGIFKDGPEPKEDRKALRKRLAREQRRIDRRIREQENGR